jgi:hypothetical protein
MDSDLLRDLRASFAPFALSVVFLTVLPVHVDEMMEAAE